MPKAKAMSTTSRRLMLASSAAALLSAGMLERCDRTATGDLEMLRRGAAVASAKGPLTVSTLSASPDAELLELCTSFQKQHAGVLAAVARHEDDEIFEALIAERWATLDKIEEYYAETPEGHRAMASVAVALFTENYGDEPLSRTEWFTLHALRGVAGELEGSAGA